MGQTKSTRSGRKSGNRSRDEISDFAGTNQVEVVLLGMKDVATELESLFQMFDRNKDGRVSKDELRLVLKKMENVTHREMDTIMGVCDTDGDGTLDYQEFCSYVRSVVEGSWGRQVQLWQKFQLIDANGDGRISKLELQRFYEQSGGGPISLDEAERIVNLSDLDGDGSIDYTEFATMLHILHGGMPTGQSIR